MSERRVMQSKKSGGDILCLCNHGETWSPMFKRDAMYEIEKGKHSYYVLIEGEKVFVKVFEGELGKHLRTDPDKNLQKLP